MGVGTPEDIIDAIARGVDMFDCVYPTRCARHALALTSRGRLNLRNAAFANDFAPLDDACSCSTCEFVYSCVSRALLSSGRDAGCAT